MQVNAHTQTILKYKYEIPIQVIWECWILNSTTNRESCERSLRFHVKN